MFLINTDLRTIHEHRVIKRK